MPGSAAKGLVYFVVNLLSLTGAVHRPSSISISDNGYSNILVAIHPYTRESRSLVHDIKSMFTEGSQYLYTATEKRAYFRQVTILVPSGWTNTSTYPQAAGEMYSNADVIIQDSTMEQEGEVQDDFPRGAFTRSYGGCGQRGVRINILTDIFDINGPYMYGRPGRLLVHHWATYRWGVFPELPESGEASWYFSPTTRRLEAVRCNINMAGRLYRKTAAGMMEACKAIDPTTGMYDPACIFDPTTFATKNQNVTASIMDRQKLPSIVHFCNDDTNDPRRVHNYESPSRHNRLCGGRSTWSVISQSQDFRGGQNAPRDIRDVTPHFKVVQMTSSRRLVLAIDTSQSMKEDGKLTEARQAAASFIEDGLDDDTAVGLVTFDTVARVAAPITKVGDSASRRRLTSRLPRDAGGATSVGRALLKAIELLHKHDQNATDAFIVIITDGRQTAPPDIADVTARVKAARAVVSVIMLGRVEDPDLEELTKVTGGRYYLNTNKQRSTAAVDAMMDLSSVLVSGRENQQPVQIFSKVKILGHGDAMQGSFLIDPSLGKHTRFVLTYAHRLPEVHVTSPTGREYSALYPEFEHDESTQRVKITIPYKAQVGRWHFSVSSQAAAYEKVSVMVLSSTKSPALDPLHFTGAIFVDNETWPIRSYIVAEATRGDRPVKDVEVKATVERPNADPVVLELYDLGVGADIVKDDGVYSRYFTGFTVTGRYTVRVEMLTKAGDVMADGDIASAYAGSVHVTHPRLPPTDRPHIAADVYPPMRITDLRVLHTSRDNTSGLVELAWTAPGDDADLSQADSYTIVMTPRALDQLTGHRPELPASAVVRGSLTQPKPFGHREEMLLKFSLPRDTNVSLVFSVFAADESGNRADISNLVTVGFGWVPDVTTSEYLRDQPAGDTTDKREPPARQKVVIAGVVGFVVALLGVTVVVTVVVQLAQGRPGKWMGRQRDRAKASSQAKSDCFSDRSLPI